MSSAPVAPAVRRGNLLTQIGRAIRWRLPLLLLVAVPMSSAALWELNRQPDVYEAVTILSVAPRAEIGTSSDILRLSAQRYAVVLGSGTTLSAVAEATGLSEEDLRTRVDVSVPTETANIRIVARLRSAEQAARVANEFGTVGQSRASTDRLVLVEVTSAAQVPQQPASPPRTLVAALVLLVAVGTGLAAAMVLERVRPRLRTEEDVEAAAGAPVLGILPRAATPPTSALGALGDEDVGGATRALRTRFLARRSAADFPPDVAVTSADSATDGTAVSTLLALALADSGVRTALVAAGSTGGALAERLELDPAGATHAAGDDALPGAARTWVLEDRLVVVTPPPVAGAGDQLTDALPKLLSDAGEIADLVLVDAPPVPDDVAGPAVVTHVHAALLVVTRGASAEACRLASTQLAGLRVPVLGAVIIEGGGRRARATRPGEPGPGTATSPRPPDTQTARG